MLINKIAAKARIADTVTLKPPVRIYNNVRVKERSEIGSYSYIAIDTIIESHVTIGKYCSIASGVKIGVHPHPVNFLSTHPFQYNTAHFDFIDEYSKFRRIKFKKPRKTTVGNDVWIGANVTISRGVTVGNGAIIAAHAFVKDDVAPFSIVGGAPAKHIKFRFDDETIDKLLRLKWWDLKPEWLNGVSFEKPNNAIETIRLIKDVKISRRDRLDFSVEEINILSPNKLSIKLPEARVDFVDFYLEKVRFFSKSCTEFDIFICGLSFDFKSESVVAVLQYAIPDWLEIKKIKVFR